MSINHFFQPRTLYRQIKAHFSTIQCPLQDCEQENLHTLQKLKQLANEMQCQRLHYFPTSVTLTVLTKVCLIIWFL